MANQWHGRHGWVSLLCLLTSLLVVPADVDISSNATADTEAAPPFTAPQPAEPYPIPVLGVPIMNDNYLFLMRLLLSIDYPVDHLVIVQFVEDELVEKEMRMIDEARPNATVLKVDVRPGCAEAWNMILRAFPEAPYVVIAAADIMLRPGQLRKLAEQFPADPWHFATFRSVNMNPCGWNMFALKRAVVDTVGYFDENIYPAYYEDDDYSARLHRAEPGIAAHCYMDIEYVHGFSSDNGYVSGLRRIKTIGYARRVNKCAIHSLNYFCQKWGCEPHGVFKPFSPCQNSKPFNDSSNPLSYWKFDQKLRKDVVACLKGHHFFGF